MKDEGLFMVEKFYRMIEMKYKVTEKRPDPKQSFSVSHKQKLPLSLLYICFRLNKLCFKMCLTTINTVGLQLAPISLITAVWSLEL